MVSATVSALSYNITGSVFQGILQFGPCRIRKCLLVFNRLQAIGVNANKSLPSRNDGPEMDGYRNIIFKESTK